MIRRRDKLKRKSTLTEESGVALVLVLFIVALASVIVTQLTYTTTLDTSLHLLSRRSLEAEYLLKSVVSVGRAIIRADNTTEDSELDSWGPFRFGFEIPKELLGIEDPTVKLELEIRPEESKLPLRALVSGVSGNEKWRDVFTRFFERMEFDTDNLPDESGLFPGKVFGAAEVVANLIDFMDSDRDSYTADDFVSGVEGDIPEGVFPDRPIRWIGELYEVPGMNTERVRRVSPFITTFGSGSRVNINLAPRLILESLSQEIGPAEAENIIQLRATQPFDNQNRREALTPILGDEIYNEIASMIDVQSRWFQIIAKVDYGASTSFMRAYVSQNEAGELPIIRISEIFS